ncbi:MAG: HEAT repeat domain-containing protein [Bacteroidales bacterium]|nr:HEAT repeat domain-containing protein [Bacteroidales bacterium]
MENKRKETIEGILSITCLILSGLSGYIIWQKWGLFAGIAGAVISFVIISLFIQIIPKTVFHVALFENENKRVEKEEVKVEDNERKEIQKKGIVKPNIEKLKEKQDIDGLINALGYQKDSLTKEVELIHELAAIKLGEMGAKEAVNPLIQTLHDKAWGVQYAAIEALGNIGDRRAIEPIIQCVIETDIERIRGKGMYVLNEVFNLSNTKLKEIFLATKADDKAKKVALDLITEEKDPKKEIKGVKFVKMKYREDVILGTLTKLTYEVYTAKNKKQALEFIKTKSVNEKCYYIEVNVGNVNSPEVIVGLDINGTYEL